MSNTIRFAFFGTPEFAAIILDELLRNNCTPAIIITAPDRPKGRGLVMTPPPVKVWGDAHGVTVLQPEKLDDEFLHALKDADYDLFIVAAYGKILKKEVLEMPAHGTLNVHPSLLPKYRGSSPIEGPILAGDAETGVTIMLLDELMDHGPIVAQKKIPLAADTDAPGLERELAIAGGALLGDIMPLWINKEIQAVEQAHDQATFTKKIKKEDGLISLSDDPVINDRKFRAYKGWPRTYFMHKDKRVAILDAAIIDGKFHIRRIIPEGKKEMGFDDFMRGK